MAVTLLMVLLLPYPVKKKFRGSLTEASLCPSLGTFALSYFNMQPITVYHTYCIWIASERRIRSPGLAQFQYITVSDKHYSSGRGEFFKNSRTFIYHHSCQAYWKLSCSFSYLFPLSFSTYVHSLQKAGRKNDWIIHKSVCQLKCNVFKD